MIYTVHHFVIYVMIYTVHHLTSLGRRGRDCMVVWFTTTYANENVNSNPVHGEMYSIQHYVKKFVSDLRRVGDFLRVLRLPPPIQLTTTISLKYCWKCR
jgi:hypothetical protein